MILERFSTVVSVDPPAQPIGGPTWSTVVDLKSEFSLTKPLYIHRLKLYTNGVYVRCIRCNRRVSELGAICPACQGEETAVDVAISGYFTDGLGGKLTAKLNASLIYRMLGINENILITHLDIDKSLDTLNDRIDTNRVYQLFISLDSSNKGYFEVEELFEPSAPRE